MEIGKDISKLEFTKIVNSYLKKEDNNQAYERSIYYILNSTRRGGYLIKKDNEIFIFAKNYDKPKSVSLIFCSNPEIISSSTIKYVIDKIPSKEIFLHHLFEKRANEILNNFDKSALISQKFSKKISSYEDEDLFPQIIFPIENLPKLNNSTFLKNNFINKILSENGEESFKKDILEYLNISKKEFNEPEEFTILIEKDSNEKLRKMMNEIISIISSNWSEKQNKSPEFEEYYLKPIINLTKILLNKNNLYNKEDKIIFRAFYDTKIEKGGFWLGEYNKKKSLLIPHVILTDYYYREQYKFLLFDIISYAYSKNIHFVNLGGSEDENQFKLKSLPKIFFENNLIERKLYTVYIKRTP